MSSIVRAVSLALIASYPVVIYFGLMKMSLHYLGFLLIALAVIRFISLRGQNQSAGHYALIVALVAVSIYATLANDPQGFRLYPVVVNAVLLMLFCYSLFHGTPVIERIARLTEPDLPHHAIRYTRNVTWIWSAFFLCNGLVALYTALYSSMAFWALYNGCISYLLIALLFSGEWLIRREYRRRWDAPAR
jgi:uncharacterized membrane protein